MAGIASGIHHVAVVSEDLTALADFYGRILGAVVIARFDYPGLSHWGIELGQGVVLHAFQGDGMDGGTRGGMFRRGLIDHIAIEVADAEAFEVVRRRLVEEGAGDGAVTDFGSVRTSSFTDPDGRTLEIAFGVPGMSWAHGRDPEHMRGPVAAS